MDVVLITGTSKGLGHALARRYLDMGAIVIGVSRTRPDIQSEHYHHLTASVTDDDLPSRLANFLDACPVAGVDVVINNAGAGRAGIHLSEVDPAEVMNQVNVHCAGALRVLKGVQGYLSKAKIVNVTSRLGSIIQNERGDFKGKGFSYAYRIAKCAQNMLSLCLAGDPELSDLTVISINPGLLMTDSGAPDAVHTADDGAKAFVEVITRATTSGIYHAFGDEALY